jgi:cytochrome o ubiquinol oxidase operon protein cyoD
MMDISGLPVERSIRPYLIGLALALLLTAIPFALVATHALPRLTTLVVIAIAAVIQVLVHLRFFLHLSLRSTPQENLIALAFAAVLIVLMVGGTLWIMFNLHHRMMA